MLQRGLWIAVLLTAVVVVFVASIVDSYFAQTLIHVPLPGKGGLSLLHADGNLLFLRVPGDLEIAANRTPFVSEALNDNYPAHAIGVRAGWNEASIEGRYARIGYLRVHSGYLLGLLLLLSAVAWRAWHRSCLRARQEMGLCVACGYDLRATRDRCPECGNAYRLL